MRNRQTKLLVNIDAIINNYKKIQELQPDKKILPVVKDRGYGIGLNAVKLFINTMKIDTLGVAIVDEGISLRRSLKYEGEIIVLNQPALEEIKDILNYNITTSCCYIEFLEELNKQAGKNNKKAKVHIEIETGMGRTGVQIENLPEFIDKAIMLKNIEIEGIFTHFATSDTDLEYTKEQIRIFEEAVDYIKQKVSTIKYIHCGNSAAIIQIQNLPGNMVRPGIILYGYMPDEKLSKKIQIEPSCVLKSKVSFIKEVAPHTSISYGRKYITKRKSKIANVPIGYADGITQ